MVVNKSNCAVGTNRFARHAGVSHALRPSLNVVFRANNAPDEFTGDILRVSFGQVKACFRSGRKSKESDK
jgi:hypothetical protein